MDLKVEQRNDIKFNDKISNNLLCDLSDPTATTISTIIVEAKPHTTIVIAMLNVIK